MDIELICFVGSFAAYVLAFLAHTVAATQDKRAFYPAGRVCVFLGALLGTAGLLIRWKTAGHPPLSNMYESLYSLATMFAWISLFFTISESFPLIEAGAAVGAILMTGTASVFAKEVRPLVPALQSYWLHLHVSIAFVGEACFALAFILSYLYCARLLVETGTTPSPAAAAPASPATGESGAISSSQPTPAVSAHEQTACVAVVYGLPLMTVALLAYILTRLSGAQESSSQFRSVLFWILLPTVIGGGGFIAALFMARRTLSQAADRWLPPLDRLDEMAYRAISLGYPLFTIGAIIFGMVWANKAWGRYWGWDPKETWALITFLVYSGYLHVRLTKGWKGTVPAVLSIIGFLFTMFTLFGVNLVLSGLHSYASM